MRIEKTTNATRNSKKAVSQKEINAAPTRGKNAATIQSRRSDYTAEGKNVRSTEKEANQRQYEKIRRT